MELESISRANAGYNSTQETAKVSVDKEQPEVAAASSQKVAEHIAQKVAESGMTGEQKDGQDAKQKERAASEASIDDAVKSANRRMEHTRCEYSYHKETKRVSIKVINDDTDEVIREIPPEKSLKMLQKMWEMAGILVDEKR